MVNALGMQAIQGRPNISRRPLLARMGHTVKAQLPRARKNAHKLFRWVAHLAGIQSHAHDLVAKRHGLLQGLEGLVLAQMAQKTHDQLRINSQLCARVFASAVQTTDHGAHGHAALGMGLRIKKDLGMHHMIGGSALKVSPRQVIKILRLLQHTGTSVINIQKALQVGEGIGLAHRRHIRMGQSHLVAPGQLKHQLGLQAAFNVQMQLGLGHGAQQLWQAGWVDG